MFTDGNGIAIGVCFAGANTPDVSLLEETLSSIPSIIAEERHKKLCFDKGFDSDKNRDIAVLFGYIPYGRSKNACEDVCSLQFRWPVERTHSWLNRFRAILVRWEKKLKIFEAIVLYAFTKVIFSKILFLG